MLTGSCLGDDAGLAQFLREQGLAQHIVDLVRARVVEILALEEDTHAAQICRETRRLGQQGRATGVVGKQVTQTRLERLVAPQALPRRLNLFEGAHQRLGHKSAAEITEIRSGDEVLSAHHSPSLRAAATRARRSVRSAGC